MKYVLTIDDEPQIRWVLRNIFEPEGYGVLEAESGEEGLQTLLQNDIDVVLLDLQLSGISGIAALQEIRKAHSDIPVIILTAFGEIKTAIEATRLGAYDYLSKPVDKDSILVCVKRAIDNRSLVREVNHWRSKLSATGSQFNSFEGQAMRPVMEKVRLVAATDYTVMLQGETGTGKDVIANVIHSLSKRADKIFIPVDCGAIPDNLLESELFGYEKGAFTGADKRKEGLFELADGGTLFLDELGNLSIAAQAKLLRVLQDRKIMRIGAKQHKEIDVRVLVATNLNIEEQIAEGKFREDLYYRLNEFVIHLPPLRDRSDEIIPLAEFFLSQAKRELGKEVELSPEVKERLQAYAWPGNIRQLKNMIRSAALQTPKLIGLEHLPQISQKKKTVDNADPGDSNILVQKILTEETSLKEIVRDYEKNLIEEIIRRFDGDNKKAAKALGIHYTTLLEKLR